MLIFFLFIVIYSSAGYCPVGFYPVNDSLCHICYQDCSVCNGPLSLDCISNEKCGSECYSIDCTVNCEECTLNKNQTSICTKCKERFQGDKCAQLISDEGLPMWIGQLIIGLSVSSCTLSCIIYILCKIRKIRRYKSDLDYFNDLEEISNKENYVMARGGSPDKETRIRDEMMIELGKYDVSKSIEIELPTIKEEDSVIQKTEGNSAMIKEIANKEALFN